MLFNILTSLIDQYSFLNVFKYLTFRTGLSVVTSLVVVFIIGGPLIKIFSEKMITNNDYLMIKGSNATGLNNFSKKMIKGV